MNLPGYSPLERETGLYIYLDTFLCGEGLAHVSTWIQSFGARDWFMYLPGYSPVCGGTGSCIYLDTVLGVEVLVHVSTWIQYWV